MTLTKFIPFALILIGSLAQADMYHGREAGTISGPNCSLKVFRKNGQIYAAQATSYMKQLDIPLKPARDGDLMGEAAYDDGSLHWIHVSSAKYGTPRSYEYVAQYPNNKHPIRKQCLSLKKE